MTQNIASPITLLFEPEADDPISIQILVEGRIGKRNRLFLLDTGSAKSAVVADKDLIQLVSQGSETSSGTFGSPRQEDLIIVPEFEIGSIQKKLFPLVRLSHHEGAKNLLGMDILQFHACHFCFSKKKLWIDPPCPIIDEQPLLNLDLDARAHPYIDVDLGCGRLSAVWDSGAGMTLVDLEIIADHPGLFEEVGESVGTDATGVRRVTPVFRMGNVWIGEFFFQSHKVVGVDLTRVNAGIERPMDMILGSNLILQADWWFDFPNKKWSITSR